jgi:hypothetical protein
MSQVGWEILFLFAHVFIACNSMQVWEPSSSNIYLFVLAQFRAYFSPFSCFINFLSLWCNVNEQYCQLGLLTSIFQVECIFWSYHWHHWPFWSLRRERPDRRSAPRPMAARSLTLLFKKFQSSPTPPPYTVRKVHSRTPKPTTLPLMDALRTFGGWLWMCIHLL